LEMKSICFVLVVALICCVCYADDVPGIRYIDNGMSGSGFATRYWDCCRLHCSWSANAPHPTTTCDVYGNVNTNPQATSVCNGGDGAACVSQVPLVVNDKLAYAFAAVPSANKDICGKCFDLEFTGKGKYSTDRHEALKGKHLIVMTTNIGSDVESGQFDIMIPGGGLGIYTEGCKKMANWNLDPNSQTGGGMLRDCEIETDYKPAKYVECLTKKCNTAFANDPKAREGCLFLANWMNAAGNPLLEYREVECPMALKELY